MSLEHLLTELFVATRLDGVQLEAIRVRVDVMILGEQVRDRVEGGDNTEHHEDDDLLIGLLILTQVGDVLCDIMGHLRGGRRRTIFVLDHAIMELRGHGDDHMIVVRVEVTTFRHIEAERRRVMIASQQVIGVVDQTWLMGTGLRELRRPDTHVGVLRLMDSHIWRPDSVMDLTLTIIPLLEKVTAIFLMRGMHLGEVHHLGLEFSLGETLVHEEIVFLMHGTVTTLASSGEDLETTTKTIDKESKIRNIEQKL